MTLLELMISEGIEWPEGYDVDFDFVAQDGDLNLFAFEAKPKLLYESSWDIDSSAGCSELLSRPNNLASDWFDVVVTRKEYEQATTPQGHPHAAIMAEHAEVAKTNPRPWEEFEAYHSEAWWQCGSGLCFRPEHKYRRKPRTININGFDVPEPLRVAPDADSYYWVIAFGDKSGAHKLRWREDEVDRAYLSNGGTHNTKEAAELHAKALLSFTKVGDE